jgi:hypothetical protein
MAGNQDLQVNAIRKYMFTSCTITPAVWIETFLPAALGALWSVLTPDPKETLRIVGGGKSWLKQLKISVPEAELVEPTFKNKSLRFLFEFAEGVDLAVWWLFLISVTEDFLIEWSSLQMRMAGCTHDERDKTRELWLVLGDFEPDGNWYDAGLWKEVTPPSEQLSGPVINVAIDGQVAVGVSLQCQNAATGLRSGFQMRWIDAHTGDIVSQSVLLQPDAVAGNSNMSMDMQVTGGDTGRTMVLQVSSNAGGLQQLIHGRISVYGGQILGVRHRERKSASPVV